MPTHIMGEHLNFQHMQSLRRNLRGNSSFCLNYHLSVGVVLCGKRKLLERGLLYTLMHTFLHFIVSLQNRFYALALIGL